MPCAASAPASRPGRPRYRSRYLIIPYGDSEPADQVRRVGDDGVGVPGLHVVAVAPFDGNRGHAGRMRGEDVAEVVADIEALLRLERELVGGVQERGRGGLEVRGGVAPDDARGLEREHVDE